MPLLEAYFIDVYTNQRRLIDWTTPALPMQEPVDNEHDSSFESMEESMEDVMLQEQPHYSLRHLEEQPTLCHLLTSKEMNKVNNSNLTPNVYCSKIKPSALQ